MKSLFLRISVLAMLVFFGIAFHQTPVGASAQYCGKGSYRCGDLAENGTCCRDEDKCCYVSPSRGSCYCVRSGDRCTRY